VTRGAVLVFGVRVLGDASPSCLARPADPG
jgi:hypothetical protein